MSLVKCENARRLAAEIAMKTMEPLARWINGHPENSSHAIVFWRSLTFKSHQAFAILKFFPHDSGSHASSAHGSQNSRQQNQPIKKQQIQSQRSQCDPEADATTARALAANERGTDATPCRRRKSDIALATCLSRAPRTKESTTEPTVGLSPNESRL